MITFPIEITSSACAEFLDADLHGGDIFLCAVAGSKEDVSGAIKFSNSYDQATADHLNKSPLSLL